MSTPYYQHAGITIYHARYEDVLPLLAPGTVDLATLDPNYGTTQLSWDTPWDWALTWKLLHQVCTLPALQVVCSQQPFTTDLITSNRANYHYELIWKKTMPTGFLDANRRPLRLHEAVQVFGRAFGESTYNPQMRPLTRADHKQHGTTQAPHYNDHKRGGVTVYTERYPVDVLEFSNGHGGKSDHETGKPLGLLEWLIATYSIPGDLILDCGMGRGTALRAAKNLGRRAIGIDAREKCCEQAARWLAQEVLALETA